MESRRFCAALVLPALIVGGCASIETRHDFDPQAEFSAYQSFSWVADNPLMVATPGTSPLVGQRIERAVTRSLVAKGYRFVDDLELADFAVGFTVGTRDKVRITSTLEPVGIVGPGQWNTVYQRNVDVQEYTEGQLAIDIFDLGLKRAVWHGRAIKNLSAGDMKNREQTINAAVQAVLADFPPQ